MHNNGDGAATLQLIHDLHQQGISRIGVILRHAARNDITSADNVLSIGLTQQGREAAHKFGRTFPSGPALHLCSSPVERCQDTAGCIADGYRDRGGASTALRLFEYLGPFYNKDHPTVFRMADELGSSQFLRQWFLGRIAPDVMMPAPQAASILLRTMFQVFQEHPGDLRVLYLSHDWNIFLLKEQYLGLPHEEFGDVHFLEGLVLYEWQGAYYLTHHHGAPQRVAVIGSQGHTW